MRKLIPITLAAFVFAAAACGGGDNKESAKDTKTAGSENGAADLSNNPVYTEGAKMIAGYDCATCHRTSGKLTGPSFNEIAAKYDGADEAKIEELANTVIKGSTGKWGNQQMLAHPNLSLEDGKKLVKYILLLKK